MRQLVIPIFLPEAGCPGRCVFCDQQQISGEREIISPGAVPKIIEQYLATKPATDQVEVEVAFFGGTFTALPMDLQISYLSAVQHFRSRGEVKRLRVSTRPDRINNENVRCLREYGVWLLELGIQSVDNKVLSLTGRGYQCEQVEKAIRIIQNNNLEFGAQLMPGLPGATTISDIESARWCAVRGAATARIYPTLVLKNTELEHMYERGEYKPLTLEAAIEVSADMYDCFEQHNIPVIRVGLQTSQELEQPGTVVAGPWHPALGELVKSRLWRRHLDAFLSQQPPFKAIEVKVPIKMLSQARGQHNANLSWLTVKYQASVTIVGDKKLHHGEIVVR